MIDLITILTLAIELGVRVERIIEILERNNQLTAEQASDYRATLVKAFGESHWQPSTAPPPPPSAT